MVIKHRMGCENIFVAFCVYTQAEVDIIGEISEDDEKKNEKEIQTLTDKHIKLIDDKVLSKEKEIMTI